MVTGLIDFESTNAVLGWLTVAILSLAGVERMVSGDLLWAGMAAAVVAVALVPVAKSGRPREMLAWEVLAIAAVPVVVHSLGVSADLLAYLAVAALALVVAAELDAFTHVEMTPGFAVVFVVVVTMGIAGLWTIAQFGSDSYLGTTLLGDQRAVMWDLVGATAVGFVAGVLFELYLRRVSPGHNLERDRWGVPE